MAAVLVVLRLLIRSDDISGVDTGFDLDRKYGLFLAVIAAIIVAVGGRQEGRRGRQRPVDRREHRLRPVLIPGLVGAADQPQSGSCRNRSSSQNPSDGSG